MHKVKVLFCDLDGVINTNNLYRAHLIPTVHNSNLATDWQAWHEAHVNELPVVKYIEFIRTMNDDNWQIILLTARTQSCRETTCQQLADWGVPYLTLHMCPNDSFTPPHIYKVDVISDIIAGHQRRALLDGETDTAFEYMLLDDNVNTCRHVYETLAVTAINVVTEGKFTPSEVV